MEIKEVLLAANQLEEQATIYYKQRDYEAALEAYKSLEETYKQIEDWNLYVQALCEKVRCLYQMERSVEGLKEAERGIAFMEKKDMMLCVVGGELLAIAASFLISKGQCDAGITYLFRAIDIFEEVPDATVLQKGNLYKSIGVGYKVKGDYQQAIYYYQKSLQLIQDFDPHHTGVVSVYNNLANVYLFLNDHHQAIYLLKKGVDIVGQFDNPNPKQLANLYNNLGLNYKQLGSIDWSIHYLLQSLELRKEALGMNSWSVLSTYVNLGNSYILKYDFEKTLYCYTTALSIVEETLEVDHVAISTCCMNLGLVYRELERYEESMRHLERALKVGLTCLGEQHKEVANIYYNLGATLGKQGKVEEGIHYLEKAATTEWNIANGPNAFTARAYLGIALLYMWKEELSELLNYTNKALVTFGVSIDVEAAPYSLPVVDGEIDWVELLPIIYTKAFALFKGYLKTSNDDLLTASIAHYFYADQLIDEMRKRYVMEGSALNLAATTREHVYEAAMRVVWHAYEEMQNNRFDWKGTCRRMEYVLPTSIIDVAFHFMEKSRSILLLSQLRDVSAQLDATLPTDLLAQLKHLKEQINILTLQIDQATYQKDNNEEAQATLKANKEAQFYCKEAYQDLIDKIEKDYPSYFQLKYNLELVRISTLQQALCIDEAAVTYFISPDCCYSLLVTKRHIAFGRVPKPANWNELITEYMEVVTGKELYKGKYCQAAFKLYEVLLQKIDQQLIAYGEIDAIQQLLLFPEEELSTLVFDALLTAPAKSSVSWSVLPFLIRKYAIHYHYSATVWMQHRQRLAAANHVFKKTFLGVAPVFETATTTQTASSQTLANNGLFRATVDRELAVMRNSVIEEDIQPLLASEREVEQVAKLFEAASNEGTNKGVTHLLLQKAATAAAVKEQIGDYKYVLISSHAEFNPQQPAQTGILLAGNIDAGKEKWEASKLCVGDVYTLTLNADLLVLNCCETGLGVKAKGEGLMGLNRAFLYTGAANVIYTLFKVDDNNAADLIFELFKKITIDSNGDNYLQALHQTKLKMIQAGMSPVAWAAYLLMGE